ncbi:MAG: AAA family ATPase, partial [bacterium]
MDSNTSPNPFLARNAIDDPERFFGRKMEIQQLYDNINSGGESGSPQCVSVVGERRIGKSSLLHYVAHPDIRKEHVDSALNCAFVQVDFSILGVNKEDITPKVFFQETLSSLEKELGLEFKVKPTYANFRSVVEELAEKYRILILIDEFDLLIHNDNFE